MLSRPGCHDKGPFDPEFCSSILRRGTSPHPMGLSVRLAAPWAIWAHAVAPFCELCPGEAFARKIPHTHELGWPAGVLLPRPTRCSAGAGQPVWQTAATAQEKAAEHCGLDIASPRRSVKCISAVQLHPALARAAASTAQGVECVARSGVGVRWVSSQTRSTSRKVRASSALRMLAVMCHVSVAHHETTLHVASATGSAMGSGRSKSLSCKGMPVSYRL